MKKIIIKEIDKLYSTVHKDRVLIEYLIYLVLDDNETIPLEAYTEFGVNDKNARVNELILLNFSVDGEINKEIIQEISFDEYLKELSLKIKK